MVDGSYKSESFERETFLNCLTSIESEGENNVLSFSKIEVKKDKFISGKGMLSLGVTTLNDYLPAATRSLRPLPALNLGTILS